MMFVGKLLLENRKALVTFLPDTMSQTTASVPARAGEQVLSWDEEVVEHSTFQMGYKVIQEQLETVAQARGPPVTVFSSGAAGV